MPLSESNVTSWVPDSTRHGERWPRSWVTAPRLRSVPPESGDISEWPPPAVITKTRLACSAPSTGPQGGSFQPRTSTPEALSRQTRPLASNTFASHIAVSSVLVCTSRAASVICLLSLAHSPYSYVDLFISMCV